ncbi:MAG: M23 family metallopeptidase [Salibacteraceae bacterium]
MSLIKRYIFTVIAFSFFGHVLAQSQSEFDFSSPLNIPLYLAGNFGEIRGGHFHAGIDIKTQQKEGFPVLAAADGYVSRVKISLGGYGNAIYITHKDGYTTAYGHLQKFNSEINSYILETQYAEQKFTVERFFNSTQIPVKKGDTIATSGNTGGSGGPHLHFEIRKNGIPQNPLKFGFDIKDNIPPTIKNIGLYPLNDTSFVNGNNQPLMVPVKKMGNAFVISKSNPLKARGVIGIGVEAIDKLNGSNNRCGVYNVSLFADSNKIYSHQMDQISFGNTRFIQTHVDFYETKKNKRRIQKSYLNSYNKLKIYEDVKNKGFLFFSKYGHELHYDISDVYGNTSNLDFKIDFDTSIYDLESAWFGIEDKSIFEYYPFPYDSNNYYESAELKVTIPKFSLYEDLKFTTKSTDTLKNGVSKVHYIQDLYTALQKRMTVSILCDTNNSLGSKYYAVSLNKDLKMIAPEGGKYKDGWVTFKTRSMGPYTILIDTIAPTIRPINFSKTNSKIKSLSQLILKAADASSGVKTYNAYIDGEWVLLEYDYKTDLIWIDIEHLELTKGEHTLEVKIGDSVNNFKTFSFNFIW